jgi:hypothetical protein
VYLPGLFGLVEDMNALLNSPVRPGSRSPPQPKHCFRPGRSESERHSPCVDCSGIREAIFHKEQPFSSNSAPRQSLLCIDVCYEWQRAFWRDHPKLE